MTSFPIWFYVTMAACGAILLSWRVRYAATMLIYAGIIVLAIWTALSLARGDFAENGRGQLLDRR
jgi:hypothetical protein